MNKKEQQELLEEGYLRVNVIFELVGKPKNHIEQTLKTYIENVKTQEDIHAIKEEFEEATELDEGVFSSIAEVELLVKNMEKLTWLSINFTPASIELLEPTQLSFESQEVTLWMNDLLSRLHEIGMIQKNLHGQHQVLVKNFNAMTRNAILLALQTTNEIESVAKKIGMNTEHTKKFIDALIQEKKVREEKGKYHLSS